MLKDLQPFLVPILTTILGAIGIWLQEWRQTHDERYQRKQARTEATELVAFIDNWVKTQQLTSTPEEFEQIKETAHQQLSQIYLKLSNAQDDRLRIEEHSLVQRALLLYRPPGIAGWIAHSLFYLSVAFIFLLSIGLFAPSSSADVTPLTWPQIITTYAVLLIPLLLIRAWAVDLETRHNKRLAKK